jgi:thiol-disulfide isomerase/thioredoxin
VKKTAVLLLTLLLPTLLLQGCADKPQTEWMIVNYWAIWCAPCREEIPEFNAFAEAHADTLAMRSVNFDDVQGKDLEKQRGELGIAFPSLTAEEKARLQPAPGHPLTLPTTYVYHRNKLVATLQGPQTEATLKAAMTAPGS